MEAWIQDISTKQCYTRYGKVIPKRETKIDIEKYFGRDVLTELKNDSLIKVIVHNAEDLQAEKKAAAKKRQDNAMKNFANKPKLSRTKS